MKQTDFNGEYSYSKIIAINYNLDIKNLQIINPFTNQNNINFTISNPNLENLTYEIVNTLGEVLIYSKVDYIVEKSRVVINTDNFSQGIYFIKLSSDTETCVAKLLL